MLYEALLAFAVAFAAAAVLVLAARWASPLEAAQRLVLQAWILVVLGAYFTACWIHGRQTLAQKTWRLQLESVGGGGIGWFAAIVRYLAGWYLVVPGLVLAQAYPGGYVGRTALFVAGWLATVGASLGLPGRRLLHDRIAGTRLVRRAA